jgi:hypothetical protein
MRRLMSRLIEIRSRPVLVVLAGSFVLTWFMRIPARNGSTWDSLLANVAWALLIGTAIYALLSGIYKHRSPK